MLECEPARVVLQGLGKGVASRSRCAARCMASISLSRQALPGRRTFGHHPKRPRERQGHLDGLLHFFQQKILRAHDNPVEDRAGNICFGYRSLLREETGLQDFSNQEAGRNSEELSWTVCRKGCSIRSSKPLIPNEASLTLEECQNHTIFVQESTVISTWEIQCGLCGGGRCQN